MTRGRLAGQIDKIVAKADADAVRRRTERRIEHGVWFGDLGDPQILINHDAQTTLVNQLTQAGHNGAMLLESAREALVGAIHLGLAMAAIMAVVSVWQSRRVPPIKLQRKAEPVIHVD